MKREDGAAQHILHENRSKPPEQEVTPSMLSPEKIVTDLYLAFFDRQPDADGLRFHSDTLRSTGSIESIIASFLISDEFKGRFITSGDDSHHA